MDRLAITRQGNSIVVNVDEMYQQDENETQWKAAFMELA